MSSKTETPCRSSLRRWSLAIFILGTSVSWVSANVLAQETLSARTMTRPPSWSLDVPGTNSAPHLVIGMPGPEDAPSNDVLRLPKEDAASSPSDFHAQTLSGRQTIQRSPDVAAAKTYSLLGGSSAPESFLYGYRVNHLPRQQRLADNESFAGQAEPRPLAQLEFGSWSFPVMLSSPAVSR
jgi:hypothetical protein